MHVTRFAPVLGAVVVLAVAGCTRQPLTLSEPPIALAAGRPAVAVTEIADSRMGGRTIDAALEEAYLADIEGAIVDRLEATGKFSGVEVIAPGGATTAEYLVTPALTKLEWSVPNYESKVAGGAAAGLALGLVGAAVMAAVQTDVYGDAGLQIDMTETAGGMSLIDEVYLTHFEDRVSLMVCDSPETKAAVVTRALEAALDRFEADVEAAMEGAGADAILAAN